MPSLRRALAEGIESLAPGRDSARLDAEILLGHVTGLARHRVYAHPEAEIDPAALAAFRVLVARRARGEPIAYLTGRREFWSLSLSVTPATLIPRPATERLVEVTLERAPRRPSLSIADLGTGCGAVALALAHERPHWWVLAVDDSLCALRVARTNAGAHSLTNVSFVGADWCEAIASLRMDVIVSNPPYVPSQDRHLSRGDVAFEPRRALCGGSDGLDSISRIVDRARASLRRGGLLVLEHGHDQGRAVRRLLEVGGYNAVSGFRDLAGHQRVAVARWD